MTQIADVWQPRATDPGRSTPHYAGEDDLDALGRPGLEGVAERSQSSTPSARSGDGAARTASPARGADTGVDAGAPGAERLEGELAERERLERRVVPLAQAEDEREPVVPLEPVVVGPAQVVVDAERGGRAGRVALLLLGDEGVDERLHLGRAREREPGVGAVALPVDAGAVHRDEEARVGVLLGDRGDPGPVEGEVRAHVDVEERDRLARSRRPAASAPTRPSRRRGGGRR